LPKKRTKKNLLTKEDKHRNRQLASELPLNENVIGVESNDLKLSPIIIEIGENDSL